MTPDCAGQPLANDHVVVLESPDPETIYSGSPGIVRLPSGRLVATCTLRGPGVGSLPGRKFQRQSGAGWQGKIFTSDDGGSTWIHRTNFPFTHARPFTASGTLYVLGHAGDLTIIRSDDAGETWSSPARLTDGEKWHQAPCNVHHAHGCVYLVMERRTSFDLEVWPVGEMAPVLMRGREDWDLTRRENWTFASELSFREVLSNVEENPDIDYFGVPFFRSPYPRGQSLAPGRRCAPIGWLETNVVQFTDPDHIWHDPSGQTFHLWSRAHTGGTGYACVSKVVEQGDEPGTGSMETMLETVPSGKTMLFTPCPGGQMKFHVIYDDVTNLYWLLSTQATDSMTRPARLPKDRYSLPNNERRRLQLHFSKNMVDWCFAGMVAVGPVEKASRHYAAMTIDGENLAILSRSGDRRAKSPHDGNFITFHCVDDFRRLVY